MKTPEPMKLHLRPTASGEHLQLSLHGMLPQAQTPQSRRRLLAMLESVARPAALDVALSADGMDGWAWSHPWTDALDDVVSVFSVRFVARGGRRAGR